MDPIKLRVKRIDYSYHPDFVQDNAEPKGYRILDTGKYVVEWDVCRAGKTTLNPETVHFRHNCETEQEAIQFCHKLKKGLDENGAVVVDSSNGYYVGM